jgi:hypothetical protein
MIDYYLQTADEQAMNTALIEANAATTVLAQLDDAGEVIQEACIQLTKGVSLDVIGLMYERTGGTDEELVMTAIPGWYFNVRSEEPIDWPENVVISYPKTPCRVWG